MTVAPTRSADTTEVFLQARTSRVAWREHGVVVAAVPWARPGSRFTTAFEDTAAWLVCHATLSMVAVLLRVAWRSVADINTRVVAERAARVDRLAGLRRIGIDEISKGPALPAGRGRSRLGSAGVGGQAPQHRDVEPVLR